MFTCTTSVPGGAGFMLASLHNWLITQTTAAITIMISTITKSSHFFYLLYLIPWFHYIFLFVPKNGLAMQTFVLYCPNIILIWPSIFSTSSFSSTSDTPHSTFYVVIPTSTSMPLTHQSFQAVHKSPLESIIQRHHYLFFWDFADINASGSHSWYRPPFSYSHTNRFYQLFIFSCSPLTLIDLYCVLAEDVGVCRVCYDLTPKPIATLKWE